jgi:hypothetical protein
MSKTAYFITDEQVEVLQGLLVEKIEADYAYYSVLQPLYEALIGRWTPNNEEDEEDLDRCRLGCVCSDEEKEKDN